MSDNSSRLDNPLANRFVQFVRTLVTLQSGGTTTLRDAHENDPNHPDAASEKHACER